MLLHTGALLDDAALAADVCIIGAGPAGLTVARELSRHEIKTIVLESGGATPRVATQRLADGIVTGQPYYPLDECRVRALGGTTRVWGGWLEPLEAVDFRRRDWIPNSGWPFDREELIPYYERAYAVCGVPADEPERVATGVLGSTIRWTGNEDFQNTLVRIRPTRFGEVYGSMLLASRQTTLVLGATVVGLMLDRGARRVETARVVTSNGKTVSVAADVFVLALGGIDNARLLLHSVDAKGIGIGNEHDLVGRYFTDHVHVALGVLTARGGVPDFYRSRERGDASVRGAIALTETAQARLQ